MPPQQPHYGQPSAPAHGPEQYDFIMNAGGQRPGGRLMNASTGSRVFIIVGGMLVLIIIAWVFLSFVTRRPGANMAALTTIAQEQTELARISDQPASLAGEQSTRNFARTTELNLLSEQQLFVTYVQKHGLKLKDRTLGLKRDPTTDTRLKDAQTNGTYDAAYTLTAQTQLNAYERSLTQAFQASKLTSEKQLLQKAHTEAQLLVEQSKQK